MGLTIRFICGLNAVEFGMVVTGVISYDWRGVLHIPVEMF